MPRQFRQMLERMDALDEDQQYALSLVIQPQNADAAKQRARGSRNKSVSSLGGSKA